jgi:putative peptide zinc metalloprotease protein
VTTALDARPRLRDDLKITRREYNGRVQYVIKLPDEGKYYQFGEAETGLMRLMDGRRAPAEIAALAADRLGAAVSEGQVGDFAARLKRLGIVERTPAERHMMLMERVRSQRRVRVRQRAQGSVLRLRFSIGDPDRLFDGIVARAPWLWSRAFVITSLVLFFAYGIVLASRWDEFWSGTLNLYLLTGVSISYLVYVWLLIIVIGGIHELGHGLTTKWFGGEVHEIGAMMLYFSPALFCNTNDAWTFERRSQRLWVTFAGPWIEMVIASLGALLWVVAEPGTFVHQLGFLTVLVGGISAVITNFNPLLPLDGYYALSDWLEIPNLRRRSFQYWGWMGKRYALGVNVPSPRVTPRERRVFLLYGGLALGYSVLVAILSLVWLILVVGRFIGPWVWAILAIIVVRAGLHLSGRTATITRTATVSWRAALRHRRRLFAAGGLVILALLLLLVPWTFRAKGEFTVAAVPRMLVRAPETGILDRMLVLEGDSVGEGQELARLWSPELMVQTSSARAAVLRLGVEAAGAESRGDLAAASAASALLAEARRQLELLEARVERLTVRSPSAGVVIGYRLDERLGERLAAGDLLLEVAPGGRQARVRVPPRLSTELRPGMRAGLRLPARPSLEFRSEVAGASPMAGGDWVDVEIPFPRSGWQPAPGMTGIAKIEMWRGTIGEALVRKFRQTVRADLWL